MPIWAQWDSVCPNPYNAGEALCLDSSRFGRHILSRGKPSPTAGRPQTHPILECHVDEGLYALISSLPIYGVAHKTACGRVFSQCF